MCGTAEAREGAPLRPGLVELARKTPGHRRQKRLSLPVSPLIASLSQLGAFG
jgi:hypothetical protein